MAGTFAHLTLVDRLLCAVLSLTTATAFGDSVTRFQEASPPPGTITGYMNAGGRTGAVVAGGRTVFSNDTFTVTHMGRGTTWKVLGFDGMRGRFARQVTAAPDHVPPENATDFADLVALLQNGAASYKAASTRLLKDRAMAETRDSAQRWCEDKNCLRIRAVLSELEMAGERSARIRLKHVDTGTFKDMRGPALYIHSLFEISVPIQRDQAFACKVGDTVVLWGKPVFRPQSDVMSVIDGIMRQTALTSFRSLADTSLIGALDLSSPECEIYDPNKDTVKTSK